MQMGSVHDRFGSVTFGQIGMRHVLPSILLSGSHGFLDFCSCFYVFCTTHFRCMLICRCEKALFLLLFYCFVGFGLVH